MIFCWCGGYLFRLKNIKDFLKGILKNQYFRFVMIELSSLLLTPFWFNIGAISEMDNWGYKICGIFKFTNTGVLIGAMWFVPFYTLSLVIYYLVNIAVKKYGDIMLGICTLLLGILGVYLVNKNLLNFHYFNRALLSQPVFFIGNYCKKKWNIIKNYIKKWMFIPLAGIIFILNSVSGKEVELTKNLLYGNWGFYLITFAGILFCLSLGMEFMEKKTGDVIACIGKNSYWIMALHFMFFKIWDLCVSIIVKGKMTTDLKSYPNFSLIYFMTGILGPIIVSIILNKIVEIRKCRYEGNN